MNEWLSQRADVLAEAAHIDRQKLELGPHEIETLLDLAGFAAHESGARTNAPLLCYLIGRAQGADVTLGELAGILRSTS